MASITDALIGNIEKDVYPIMEHALTDNRGNRILNATYVCLTYDMHCFKTEKKINGCL